MGRNKKDSLSLSGIVDKMNEKYDGLVWDGFNLGVDKRIIPIMVDDKLMGWRIQKQTGDIWVDICDKTFNTMEELINNLKEETCKEILWQ